jgi:hypothetical protein
MEVVLPLLKFPLLGTEFVHGKISNKTLYSISQDMSYLVVIMLAVERDTRRQMTYDQLLGAYFALRSVRLLSRSVGRSSCYVGLSCVTLDLSFIAKGVT